MTTRFGRLVSTFFLEVDVALGELSALLQENITGVQVVRAFAREPYEIKRFEQGNRKLYKARVHVIRAFGKIMPTSHLLVTLSTILILWFGGRMVLQGEMTIGEVVAFNSYLLMLAAPAQQLTWLVNSAGEAAAGLKRTIEVLDLDPQIKNAHDAVRVPVFSGEVDFRNVCFRYEGQNIPALEDINLKVDPNQLIALIGPTGSGKT